MKSPLQFAAEYARDVLSRVDAFGGGPGANVSKAELGTALRGLAAALDAPEAAAAKENEAELEKLIGERDGAEDVIVELCKVIGWTPEWSSAYCFNDAIQEANERVAALERRAENAESRANAAAAAVAVAGRWKEYWEWYSDRRDEPLYLATVAALTAPSRSSDPLPAGEITLTEAQAEAFIAERERAHNEWLGRRLTRDQWLDLLMRVQDGRATCLFALEKIDAEMSLRAVRSGVTELPPSIGLQLIAGERHRQISVEGYTEAHDNAHRTGELIDAGLSYIHAAINVGHPAMQRPPSAWPWGPQWWKPSDDPVRNLTKAGALIAAEIDRLDRSKLLPS